MKRFLIPFILIVFFITGCTQKPGKTVIKFMSWGSKSEVAIILPLIEEFEAKNPDIKIDFMHTPENYFQKLHLLAASGLVPDVVFVNNIYGPLYAENNIFLDLKKYFTETNNYHKKALEVFNHKGIFYAVPRDVSNMVIYYNKDTFDRKNIPYPSPDWTIEDFTDTAQKLSDKNTFGISFEENPIFWLPYLFSNGGGIISPDLKHIVINEPQSVQAIQLYADLRNKLHAAPTKSQTGSMTMAQMFMQGKLAMQLSGRWFMPIYKKEIGFNWGVARFPKGSAGSVVGCDSSGWAISAKSKHPEEAWRFVKFLSSKDSIQKFTDSGLITPARSDVKDPETIFAQVIDSSVPTPVTANYQRILDILNTALEPVWAGNQPTDKAINRDLAEKLEKDL